MASDGWRHGGRREKGKFVSFALALCLLSACDGEYARKSEAEIHAEARKLPLAKRYDFHLHVMGNSSLPPNGIVAYDIAALGDPAWRYVMQRGLSDPSELENAVDVLNAFDRKCTAVEYRTLREATKRTTYDGTKDQDYRLSSVDLACGVTVPPRDPGKRSATVDRRTSQP